jgi:H+/gluconate symporter-like permease
MNNDTLVLIIGIIVALITIVAAGFQLIYSMGQIKKSRENILKAESRVEAAPEKVKPSWDLARITLESYFNRNLSQVTYIFWLSVIVMIIGLVIIAWGISQSIKSPNIITPAIIASIVGVITEFIGATFLFIYRSTIQQAINYSQTLERINSVGMAMQILDTMPDETKPDDLKNKTKAILVELLVRQAHGTIDKQNANKKNNNKEEQI